MICVCEEFDVVYKEETVVIEVMKPEDYEEILDLCLNTPGMGLNESDDSKEGITAYLKRNPNTCFVARKGARIVGVILSGHDGRRGCLYHVCVHEGYRRHGIGKAMVVRAMEKLKEEQISKVSLIAFTENDIGNAFWNTIGWTERLDLNYYEFTLNEKNITAFNEQ